MIINTILRKKLLRKDYKQSIGWKTKSDLCKKRENIEDGTTCDDSIAKKAIAAQNQDHIA